MLSKLPPPIAAFWIPSISALSVVAKMLFNLSFQGSACVTFSAPEAALADGSATAGVGAFLEPVIAASPKAMALYPQLPSPCA